MAESSGMGEHLDHERLRADTVRQGSQQHSLRLRSLGAPAAGAETRVDTRASTPTEREAFWFWLKLGMISFGGRAGQIAIMHAELVEKRRWIYERRYLHALNFCMALPGPEAQQLAYMGYSMHGVRGALTAGGLWRGGARSREQPPAPRQRFLPISAGWGRPGESRAGWPTHVPSYEDENACKQALFHTHGISAALTWRPAVVCACLGNKTYNLQDVFNGSDGTRTRDLRRDRPAF